MLVTRKSTRVDNLLQFQKIRFILPLYGIIPRKFGIGMDSWVRHNNEIELEKICRDNQISVQFLMGEAKGKAPKQ